MRIGIEYISALGAGGISVYARELLRALAEEGLNDKFFYYTLLHHAFGRWRRRYHLPGNVALRGVFVPVLSSAVLTRLGERFSVVYAKFRARRDRLDVLHFLNPLAFTPTSAPMVTTIHDLAILKNPAWAKQSTRELFEKLLPDIVAKSSRIIAISESTRRDILERFPAAEKKISMVYYGRSLMFKRVEGAFSEVSQKYGIVRPFILCVAEIQPRKNIEMLLKAYTRLSPSYRKNYDVVIVGTARNATTLAAFHQRIADLGIAGSVRVLGYVPLADLPLFYSACSVFVYPSFYEGFGLPLLEALQCGAPAISSSVSSLPEVGGDAVFYVDPRAVDELTEKLAKLLSDGILQKTLSAKGPRQAEKFSWQKAARETLEVYRGSE